MTLKFTLEEVLNGLLNDDIEELTVIIHHQNYNFTTCITTMKKYDVTLRAMQWQRLENYGQSKIHKIRKLNNKLEIEVID